MGGVAGGAAATPPKQRVPSKLIGTPGLVTGVNSPGERGSPLSPLGERNLYGV